MDPTQGGSVPQLLLLGAGRRGTDAAAELQLLKDFAVVAGGVLRWWPAEGRRSRGQWLVVVEGPALLKLASALAQFPLAYGGRWRLLPEALALAAAESSATPDRWPPLRRRWAALPSGRPLGGRRRLPP